MASFADQLRRIAEKRKAAIETAVKSTVLEMHASMVRMSPVDTGRFRASWSIGVGAPGPLPAGLRFDAASVAALQVRGDLADWQPGQTIYVTNPMPYGPKLENGWSKQAPAGMVRVTIADFRARFSERLAEALAS